MRSSSPASISLYIDSDVHRVPFQAILPSLYAIGEKPFGRKTINVESFEPVFKFIEYLIQNRKHRAIFETNDEQYFSA